MKKMILPISLGVLFIISLVININQNSNIESLNVKVEERDERIIELEDQRDELREERSDAWVEIAELKSDLNNIKRRQSQFKPKKGIPYRAKQSLEMYTTFSDRSAVIGDIPKGAIVDVLNSSFSKFWEVRYNDLKGWVLTDTRSKVDKVFDDAIGEKKDTRTLERIK